MPARDRGVSQVARRSAGSSPARLRTPWPLRGVEGRVEIPGEVGVRGTGGGRQRADDQSRASRIIMQSLRHKVTKAALDLVPDNRRADRLGYHKSGTGGRHDEARKLLASGLRCYVHMDDDGTTADTSAAAYGDGEITAVTQSVRGRQHAAPALPRLRRPGGRDPCHGGRTGLHGRPGCAYAAGSRGSSRADGCSAGTCACSRRVSCGHPRARGPGGVVYSAATLTSHGNGLGSGATVPGYTLRRSGPKSIWQARDVVLRALPRYPAGTLLGRSRHNRRCAAHSV